MNLAELTLKNGRDEGIAIYFAREGDKVEEVTWKDLRERTRSVRSALVNSGVKSGDVVAAVISNSVDAFVICLAALSIGAIWSSASCDLGPKAISDRLVQVKPKVVFADNGYKYAGKIIMLHDRIQTWAGELASISEVQNVVLLPTMKKSGPSPKFPKQLALSEFLSGDTGLELKFEKLPFDHPAFILFSSGTVSSHACLGH